MSYRQLDYYYNHAKERNEYYHKRHVERKANHLCADCGEKLPDDYKHVTCRKCLDHKFELAREYERIKKLKIMRGKS